MRETYPSSASELKIEGTSVESIELSGGDLVPSYQGGGNARPRFSAVDVLYTCRRLIFKGNAWRT